MITLTIHPLNTHPELGNKNSNKFGINVMPSVFFSIAIYFLISDENTKFLWGSEISN
jgi:hypothetical protein